MYSKSKISELSQVICSLLNSTAFECLMTDYVVDLQKLRVKDMYHQFVWLCGELWIRPSVKSRPSRVSQSKDKGKSKFQFLGGPLSYLFCQISLEFNLEEGFLVPSSVYVCLRLTHE